MVAVSAARAGPDTATIPAGGQRNRRGAREDGPADHAAHPVPFTAKLAGDASLLV